VYVRYQAIHIVRSHSKQVRASQSVRGFLQFMYAIVSINASNCSTACLIRLTLCGAVWFEYV